MTEVGLILVFSDVRPVSQPGRQIWRGAMSRNGRDVVVQLRQKFVRV